MTYAVAAPKNPNERTNKTWTGMLNMPLLQCVHDLVGSTAFLAYLLSVLRLTQTQCVFLHFHHTWFHLFARQLHSYSVIVLVVCMFGISM